MLNYSKLCRILHRLQFMLNKQSLIIKHITPSSSSPHCTCLTDGSLDIHVRYTIVMCTASHVFDGCSPLGPIYSCTLTF